MTNNTNETEISNSILDMISRTRISVKLVNRITEVSDSLAGFVEKDKTFEKMLETLEKEKNRVLAERESLRKDCNPDGLVSILKSTEQTILENMDNVALSLSNLLIKSCLTLIERAANESNLDPMTMFLSFLKNNDVTFYSVVFSYSISVRDLDLSVYADEKEDNVIIVKSNLDGKLLPVVRFGKNVRFDDAFFIKLATTLAILDIEA